MSGSVANAFFGEIYRYFFHYIVVIMSLQKIQFEWDPQKASINYRKHKVSFEEAQSVFLDDHARLMSDPDHSIEEDRFIVLGLSRALRLLVVCHCYRAEDHVIRIISARKAVRAESLYYKAG